MRSIIVCLLVACGPTAVGPGDGPQLGPDAANGTVNVTVTTTIGDGAPDPTAVVFFMDGSGDVEASVTTNQNGSAQGIVPSDGMVTVLQTTTQGGTTTDTITSVRGVQPGDQLQFGVPQSVVPPSGSSAAMTASFPAPATGTTPVFAFACGSASVTTTTATFEFPPACQPSSFDVVGLGVAPAGGSAYLYQRGVTFASGSAFAITAPWQATGASKITVQNAPAGLVSIAATIDIWLGVLAFQLDSEAVATPATTAQIAMKQTISQTSLRASLLLTQLGGSGAGVPVDELIKFTNADEAALDQTIDGSAMPLPIASEVMQSANATTWTTTRLGRRRAAGVVAGELRHCTRRCGR